MWEWIKDLWEKDPITFFTSLWVAIFILTAISTARHWLFSNDNTAGADSREHRGLQRANLRANPRGIRLARFKDQVLGFVEFENNGELPARDVQWFLRLTLSDTPKWRPSARQMNRFRGNKVIPPGAKMRRRTEAVGLHKVLKAEARQACVLYVWGRVKYEDGLETERFIDFCHRYDVRVRKAA